MALLRLLKPHLSDLQQLGRSNLTTAQFWTLMLLREEGPLTVSAIAERVGLTRAATSHLLDRLVVRRLIARKEDPEDRRQKQIRLTRAGEELVAVVDQARRVGIARIVTHLDAADRDLVSSRLTDLLPPLEQASLSARLGG